MSTAQSIVLWRLSELTSIRLDADIILQKSAIDITTTEMRHLKGDIVIVYGHLEGGIKDLLSFLTGELSAYISGKTTRQVSSNILAIYGTALCVEFCPPPYDANHAANKNFFHNLFVGHAKYHKHHLKLRNHIIPDVGFLNIPDFGWPGLGANADFANIRVALAAYDIDISTMNIVADLINRLVKTRHSIAHTAAFSPFLIPENIQFGQYIPCVDEIIAFLGKISVEIDLLLSSL